MKLLVVLSALLWFAYYKYIYYMFENDRHFSHLSTLEREMSFRTEMAFYFNYYKRIADRNDVIDGQSNRPLMSSIKLLIDDNITEYPNRINALKAFNVYPELIIGISYRLFIGVTDYLGVSLRECWVVERGLHLPLVESCEGIADHIYFYVSAIFACNAVVMPFIFLNGFVASGYRYSGAIFTTIMFVYNQSNCSRVQTSPPLRESFAHPIYLAYHYYMNYLLESQALGHTSPKLRNSFTTISLVSALLISWQFSQFILLTHLISLYVTMRLAQTTRKLADLSFMSNIFRYHLYAVLISVVLMFFNTFLLNSLYFSFILSNIIVDYIETKNIQMQLRDTSDNDSSKMTFKRKIYNCLIVSILTLILKVLISYYLHNEDDSHIWNLLLSKISNYRDFHTLLYTCSPEFDYMPLEDIKAITLTLLLPISMISTLVSVMKWPNKAVIQFNVIQTFIFMLMALLIMRLKLLFVPQLCIMTALLCRSFKLKLRWITLFALLLSLSSVQGIWNLRHQRSIIGEYFNEPLEQLIQFTITSTPHNAVFAGTMPTMANLMLSTRRPIVNHPYYESSSIRNRTYLIYQLYSSHELRGVYNDLSSLSIDYIVLEQSYCYSWSGKCRFTDIWKVEDFRLGRNNYSEDLPLICHQLFAEPKPLFKRVFANHYYHVLQLIK